MVFCEWDVQDLKTLKNSQKHIIVLSYAVKGSVYFYS